MTPVRLRPVPPRLARVPLLAAAAAITLAIGGAPGAWAASAEAGTVAPAVDAGGTLPTLPLPASADRLAALPSSLVVLVAPGHSATEVDAIAAADGLVRVGSSTRLGALQYAPAPDGPPSLGLNRLLAGAGRTPTTGGAALLRSLAVDLRGPAIRSATLPRRERLLETPVAPPNDPLYSSQWGLGAVHTLGAWGATLGSSSVLVGIVDTGIDMTHPDLTDTVAASWNFVANTSDPSDDNGHGTHVAGIIAAHANNGEGIAGLAPGVRLIVAKAVDANGNGLDVTIAQAMSWTVDHGARVINLSLGGAGDSPILDAAVDDATRRGALVVAAAGNDDGPVSNPANHAPALAVGAVALADPSATTPDARYARAPYSNHGPELAVVAPGTRILSTVPPAVIGGPYGWGSGTSMAAPFVSAEAALLWSRAPTLTVDQVRTAIVSSAVDLGPPGRDDLTGAGLIDVAAALASVAPEGAAPAASPAATPVTPVTTPAPTGGATGAAPPIVGLSGVVPGTAVSGTVTVGASASAGDPTLASLGLLLDGGGAATATGPTGTSASVAWASGGSADGLHTWRAVATDSAGNSASASATVLVANAHRRATVRVATTLAAGRSSLSSLVSVRARSPFVARATGPSDMTVALRLVNRRGRTVTSAQGTGSAWLTLAGLPAGRYTLVATVGRTGVAVHLTADWYR